MADLDAFNIMDADFFHIRPLSEMRPSRRPELVSGSGLVQGRTGGELRDQVEARIWQA
jgi:hypothetical protein